jgi:uncharacterized membrane protein
MDGMLGGIVGIIVLILAVCLAVSWILFPIWIYSINNNVREIKELMLKKEKK